MGTETRSVIAHNINKRMLVNQYGGCAIMAMNTISAEVQDTGVDGTGWEMVLDPTRIRGTEDTNCYGVSAKQFRLLICRHDR